ncbi:MAG: hypothetical protein AAFX92_02170 [Pseudomonadota bacterium]
MARLVHGSRGLAAITLAASVCFMFDPAAAQDQGTNLVGTWAMTEINGRGWNGERHTTETIDHIVLEISEHGGAIFAGTYSWQLATDALAMDAGQGVTTEAEEVVLGVLDFDGTYIMVDHPDTSVIRIRIVDDNTLEMVGYEAGPHAVVSRMTFERQ